ncbi:putative Zinc finger, SWIM-type [Helianthus annuus]|nr:putative Zinc finger, SWIM-type [Helianthus annuus]
MGSNAQANGDAYTPHVLAKQAASMSKAIAYSLRTFNRQKGIFEVITKKGENVQVVNLEEKTCTCGKWEIYKYPCSHVLSVCAKLSLNTWQYVHKCYSIVDYCATWSAEFFPLPQEAYWPHSSFVQKLLPIRILNEIKRVSLVKQGYEMEWRLKKGKRLTFVEFVDNVVIIEQDVFLSLKEWMPKWVKLF